MRLAVSILLMAGALTLGQGPAAAASACRTISFGGEPESDFDGDGWNDLAVGAPNEDVGSFGQAGIVQILYGSQNGPDGARDRIFSEATPGVPGHARSGDGFGEALATGDFDGDGYCDLAVGAPREDTAGMMDVGRVTVLYGSKSGLTPRGAQSFDQSTPGIRGSNEVSDWFGHAVAAHNLGRGPEADLVIGTPSEDVGAVDGAGRINILYGSPAGLRAEGSHSLTQNTLYVKDKAQRGDHFGAVLAVGDLGKSSYAELIVGVAEEDIGSLVDAGAVQIFFGSASGLTTIDTFWHQGSTGIQGDLRARALFGHSLAVANFGKGAFRDLAVGVPGAGLARNAGEVQVLYGSADGPTTDDQLWTQTATGTGDVSESHDRFGFRLAAGELGLASPESTTHEADLVIGTPNDDRQGTDSGSVTVLYGSPTDGLTTTNAETFDGNNIDDEADLEELYYSSGGLTVRDFGSLGRRAFEGFADIAIGVPNTQIDRGSVSLVFGSESGVSTGELERRLDQDTPGVAGVGEGQNFWGFVGTNSWEWAGDEYP